MPTVYEDPFEPVEGRLSVEPLRARLHAGIDGLPPAQRRALGLRVVEELSYAEVAARLACSPGAARTRVSRALRVLRDELREEAR
jgi:RNA polymerase sigma-70 factor (ECF subfamily)